MKKEIVKVTAATAISMAVFGVAFVSINSLALASETSGAWPLPPVGTQVNSSATHQAPEEFQKPDMVFSVNSNANSSLSSVPGSNALSVEVAANIGAQYIWDVFEKSINGKTVHMMYSAHPSMSRTFWRGTVSESGNANSNSVLFEFTIDSVTGQRISISNRNRISVSELSQDVLNALQDRSRADEIAAIRQGQPPAQLAGYIQAARTFAEQHFNNTQVVNVEFLNAHALGFSLNANGNLVATNRMLTFSATDSTGRVADITIDEATKQLLSISTENNDIIPGFNRNSAASNSTERTNTPASASANRNTGTGASNPNRVPLPISNERGGQSSSSGEIPQYRLDLLEQ